ncbi:hypothetical protein Tco_1445191, partial [Tanacetum coccineum]
LQALVDGKKIIVTEASVRRDLQLNDEEGTDCLPNATIFEELTRMRSRRPKRKDTEVPQPSGPTDNVADKAVYEEMDDSLERAITTATSLDAEQDRGGGPSRQETMGDTIAQTRFENVSKTSNNSLLAGVNTPRSDEDRLKLNELMEFYTKLQQRVLDLENTRLLKLMRLQVGRFVRVIYSDEASLGDQEDASKQGRIADIDADAEINLVSTYFDADIDMFRVHDLVGDEVVVETKVSSKDVNLSVDEVTSAQALAALKSAKPKADKVMLQEPEQGIITTTTVAT